MRPALEEVFRTTIPSIEHGRKAEILHLLRERVKELTALHGAARLLEDVSRPLPVVLKALLKLLPPAWQYPEITAARVCFDGCEFSTHNFVQSRWSQKARFRTSEGRRGEIEVRYLRKMPKEAEGPFLSEERNLINSLAEMLCSFAERRAARSSIIRSRDDLELRVRQRTAELERLNRALLSEIAGRKAKERKIRAYQVKLRSLAAQMALSEERERRDLASELHERIGHTLALMKIGLSGPGGQKGRDGELRGLAEQAIRSVRELTSELGSPVLYELGFEAAVESMAEQVQDKNGIRVGVRISGRAASLDEEVKFVLFRAVKELLHNVVKHAGATAIQIEIRRTAGCLRVEVSDNGRGFAGPAAGRTSERGFGLFSIKERLGRFGGRLWVRNRSDGASVVLVSPSKIKTGGGR